MIIESIHIKNYRQFVDDKIVFAKPDGIKKFTIIQGSHGSGKTNLLNAITWCLYGIEKHMLKKDLPIISFSTLEQLKDDEIAEVCVEIVIIDDNLNRFIFNRTLNLRKSLNGQMQTIPDSTYSYPDGSKFKIIRQDKDEIIIVTDSNNLLNNIIPKSVEEYFFIAEDSLINYFKDKNGTKIREDILNMFGKKAVTDDFRKGLEKQTRDIFSELIMYKDKGCFDVKINENYNLSVISQSGFETTHTLPMSEKQILSWSFMLALNNVSDFHIPIIIDAPFTRNDDETKKNIAKNLPNYLRDQQVILFVTEEEYTQDVREVLVERVGKEYRICSDKMQGTSSVISTSS